MLKFFHQKNKKILIVSLQKCGTHLINNIMKNAGFNGVSIGEGCTLNDFKSLKRKQYLWSHFGPSDQLQMVLESGEEPVYIIFNYRDPRDALVSWFHWLHPSNKVNMHAHMSYMKKVYNHFSDDELLNIFITNDKFRLSEYNPIEAFRHSRSLFFHPKVLNVCFEDLVGRDGGGVNAVQHQTIKKIFDYIDEPISNVKDISSRAFNKNSVTFRKGKVGGYKSFLNKEQINLFNHLHGDVIEQYGYKKDT